MMIFQKKWSTLNNVKTLQIKKNFYIFSSIKIYCNVGYVTVFPSKHWLLLSQSNRQQQS